MIKIYLQVFLHHSIDVPIYKCPYIQVFLDHSIDVPIPIPVAFVYAQAGLVKF